MAAVSFTEEQTALQELARSVASADRLASPGDLSGPGNERTWRALAGSSLLELRTRTDDGPLAGALETALVVEQLGRYLPRTTPFLGVTLAIDLVSRAGLDQPAIDDLSTGRARSTVLLAPGLESLAVTEGDQRANGIAWDADGALRAYHLYAEGSARRLASVPLEGVRSVLPTDLTRDLREVADGPVDVAGATPLAPSDLDAWTAFALAMVAADEVGIMQAAVDLMVEYASERHQFGKPIGIFQAVAHRCADAFVSLEAARSMTYYAAWAVDNEAPPEALVAARRAKVYTAMTCRTTCEDLIQVLGGIGMTWEHLAHIFLRRSMLDRLTLGDDHHQLDLLASGLVEH